MYTAQASALSFKDNLFRNQVLTCVFTICLYFRPISFELEIETKLHTEEADGSVALDNELRSYQSLYWLL